MTCEGCVYAAYLSDAWYCDYLAVTGHRRPCPPGEGCTVRAEGVRSKKRTWRIVPMRKRTWDTEKARAMYDEGLSDKKIAEALGTTIHSIGFWRRALYLPPNRDEKQAEKTPERAAAPQAEIEHALDLVRTERRRQDSLWGDQSGNTLFEWVSILGEEYGELCEAVNETCFKNAAHKDRGGLERIAQEAVHVAAVAVAILETVHRRKPGREAGAHER